MRRTKSIGRAAGWRWALVLVVVAIGVTGLSASVASAASGRQHPRECTTCTDRHAVYHKVWSHYQGLKNGDWHDCVYVSKQKQTSTWGCNHSVTVGATITGSVANVPTSELTKLLGFSVSWSYSETAGNSFSVTVKPGGHGWIQAGAHYKQYRVKSQLLSCAEYGGCRLVKTQTNTVQRYQGQTYRYTGTDGSVHRH
jgi:hypothetical protein